jgi:hypothetical protein
MSSRPPKIPPADTATHAEMPAAKPVAASPAKLLRRSEAARVLGVSTSTLRRMEGTALRPELGPDGVHRFREEHVRELVVHRNTVSSGPEAYDAEMAAEVFALLDEGVHPVEIVKRHRLDPRAVEAMHAKWASMRGAFVVTGETARAIEALPWLLGTRPIRDGRQLLSNMGVIDPQVCAKCEEEAATLCARCAKAMNGHEAEQRAAEARRRRDERERERRRAEWEREFLPSMKDWPG